MDEKEVVAPVADEPEATPAETPSEAPVEAEEVKEAEVKA